MKYIIALLLTAVVLGGCSLKEDLLDVPTPATINSERDLEVVVKGLYARLNNSNAFKFRGMAMLFLSADDLYAAASGELLPFSDRTLTSVNVSGFWSVLYFTIGSANDLIAQLDTKELDAAAEQRAYGDAYFIRAFCYYYLVRLYGGVPLRLNATDVSSDFYLPRSPVEAVYTQIFSDLEKAAALLPLAKNIPAAELGRASKGAAQAIHAQAALTCGNQLALKGQDGNAYYRKTITYADSVIQSNQYQLVGNYKDLFDINRESDAYNEVIFGVRFMVDQQDRAQPAAGSEFALRFGAPNTHQVCGNPPNGAGDGSMRVMPWVADYYRTGDYDSVINGIKVIDYRNEGAFFQKGYNVTQKKYYAVYPNLPAADEGNITTPLISKYIDPNGKDGRNNGNDFFVIRFAEVYLIKAEAENELNGPTATALEAFNKVRARARNANGTQRAVPADIVPGLSRDAFRMKIFDDRGLELVGEGQRWFDLVRMRSPLSPAQTMFEYQFKEVLLKYPQKMPTYNTTTKKYSNEFAVNAPQMSIEIPKNLLYPLPADEITQNPNIGTANQNPGW
ncbi:RagB/SusD family nutrient uptake outer membrane protein [Niabella pedocola]|uniref:RagB/SusD family nutrient uptake outer membrane protein n=1 Tax=Niabella pedocola TaxID=1752077 RepID=A0ABS8PRZ4_9BACT|nr:RagB/SusD family nutrient uptake outer membrane protein [Niabella pedocola]MCD2423038.1 RagB/SusD family nutrient uptake outer membrane protein [Niabella pedocola]